MLILLLVKFCFSHFRIELGILQEISKGTNKHFITLPCLVLTASVPPPCFSLSGSSGHNKASLGDTEAKIFSSLVLRREAKFSPRCTQQCFPSGTTQTVSTQWHMERYTSFIFYFFIFVYVFFIILC